MPVYVELELNQWTINRMLRSPNGIVARNMRWRGGRVARRAARNVNSRTGRLANSIQVTTIAVAGATGVQVGSSLHYARWVHDGTGVYGPHGSRIVSPRGGVMRFTGRDGTTVYARSVRGQPGQHYLARALRAAV